MLVPLATSSVAVPLIPLSEAMIAVEPEAAAVASPLELTVATDAVAEVQLAVELMSADVLSLYFPVAVNCSVAPSPTLALAGVTDTDVRVFVGTPTDFGAIPWHPRLEIMSESEKDAAGIVNIQEKRRLAIINGPQVAMTTRAY